MNCKSWKNSSVSSMLAILLPLIFISCARPHPIPKEKEDFIGRWISKSGFQIVIDSSGTARLTQILNPNDPEFEKLNIKVAPPNTAEMLVEFRGDSVLVVADPLNYAKEYHIDRKPYFDGDTGRMVLNGIVLTRQK